MSSSDGNDPKTISGQLESSGVNRRQFVQLCSMLMVAAPAGLALTAENTSPEKMAETVGKAKRPSVIWLHFQDCTGCSESLLRTSHPDLADLILNIISLDYHETLMVASGKQAEEALNKAVTENAGKFILVCEGAVPTKENGVYMKVAGRPAIDVLKELAPKAAAVVAIGSCASWGGVAQASPNPTGATGVGSILGTTVLNIPGCPPNPYVLLGTVLEFAAMGKLPALDELGRPKFAFDRLIHDHCPRRAHFDAGRFASVFGDEGHKKGYCLFKLGCKGPVTHAACSTRHFNEIPDCWPIGIGAPCFGCTEQSVGFNIPAYQMVDVHSVTPPDAYPATGSGIGKIGVAGAGLVGLVAGALGGAAWAAGQKMKSSEESVAEAKSSQQDGEAGGR
jgi:hydrogenase small subunit